LAGVFDERAGAVDDVAFFDFSVVFLEEAGVGAQEGLLSVAHHLVGVLLVAVNHCQHVVEVDGFCFVGTAELLEAGGHGEVGQEEEEVDYCPGGLFEDVGRVGPDWAGRGVDQYGLVGQRFQDLVVPFLEVVDVLR
jgi:hypothetical protein